LKYTRILFILGAALLLGRGVTAVRADETRSPDQVLSDALPEKALPQLQEILVNAMLNAPRVIDAGLNVDQSDATVMSARSPLLPHASLNVSPGLVYQKQKYENAPPNATTSVSLFYNAGISQPVYHWGALKKGLQSAQLQKAISERNLGEVRRTLASEVRRTYFNMISSANARVVEDQGLKRLQADQEYFKGQAEAGFALPGMGDSYALQISDYKLQMRRSENNYQSQWRAFRLLTGMDSLQPSTPLPREVPPLNTKVGGVLDDLAQSLGGYTPAELANAEDRMKVEQLNYDIAKTRLRPQLDFALSASQQNQNAGGDPNRPPVLTQNYAATLNVNWNLFDGFATQAAKRSAVISLRKARTAREQSERDSQESLRNQVETLRVNWQSLQRTEGILTDSRAYVETAKKDYEAGLSPKTVWDAAVTAADNALYAANNARADYYMQIVNYLSLRGKDPAVNPVADKKTFDAAKN
jgi:outer membrane protein TolC